MTTIIIKDKIDELEREHNANPSTHKLEMGLDNYLLFKEEMGYYEDTSLRKYHGYEILVDDQNESGPVKFVSKTF